MGWRGYSQNIGILVALIWNRTWMVKVTWIWIGGGLNLGLVEPSSYKGKRYFERITGFLNFCAINWRVSLQTLLAPLSWYLVMYLSLCNWWWRHQMETFSALLAICAWNSLVTGEFPAKRTVMRSLDVFFDLHLNKWLSKQTWGWWFRTPSCSLWLIMTHFWCLGTCKHLRHTTTEKYENNGKGGYFRFDDDNNMSYRYILSITYT